MSASLSAPTGAPAPRKALLKCGPSSSNSSSMRFGCYGHSALLRMRRTALRSSSSRRRSVDAPRRPRQSACRRNRTFEALLWRTEPAIEEDPARQSDRRVEQFAAGRWMMGGVWLLDCYGRWVHGRRSDMTSPRGACRPVSFDAGPMRAVAGSAGSASRAKLASRALRSGAIAPSPKPTLPKARASSQSLRQHTHRAVTLSSSLAVRLKLAGTTASDDAPHGRARA